MSITGRCSTKSRCLMTHSHYSAHSSLSLDHILNTLYTFRTTEQQNFFYLLSENMEILIIWYLSRTCSFHQKRASSVKQTDLRNMFKKGLKVCRYINHCAISWPFASYSINFFSYKDSKDKEKSPDDSEPADKETSKMNALISCTAQVQEH